MAYEGWLQFGGVELINNSRVQAYAHGAGIAVLGSWPELPASLGDAPYTDPVTDAAPWYDPSRVESAGFHGLLGLELVGASAGTHTRAWTELIADGGVPGGARRASRELDVRAIAFATDRASMSYGLSWLGSALRGSVCGTSCSGDELCVYAACPTRPGVSLDPCLPPVPDPTWHPVTGGDTAPGGDGLLRRLFGTALIDGPALTRLAPIAGGVAAQVRFTVRAGTPSWYGEPVFVIRGEGPTAPARPDVYHDTIIGYDPWGWQATCPTVTDCLSGDPFCVTTAAPPPLAPAPQDPCFPRTTFTAGRSVFSIPRGTGADWLEKVPVVQVFTGGRAFKRLILRWYDNPTGAPCGGDLDPCVACAEIQVPWIPAGSLLTLDGRIARASLDCPGPGPALTAPRLYGPTGGTFTWPVFECSATLCCEVIGDLSGWATDSWIEIHMATRSDLI